MPKTIIGVDLKKAPKDQDPPVHNRWHPDIPSVVSVKPGDDFRVEALDWTGGQIRNDDSANDIRDCNLFPCHHLFGPIDVAGKPAPNRRSFPLSQTVQLLAPCNGSSLA